MDKIVFSKNPNSDVSSVKIRLQSDVKAKKNRIWKVLSSSFLLLLFLSFTKNTYKRHTHTQKEKKKKGQLWRQRQRETKRERVDFNQIGKGRFGRFSSPSLFQSLFIYLFIFQLWISSFLRFQWNLTMNL